MLAVAPDFETLELLFEDKYFEFIQLYWLLCDYTDNIVDLSFDDDDDKKGLKIKAKVEGIKTKDVVAYIQQEIDDSDMNEYINIWEKRKEIHINIKDLNKEPKVINTEEAPV